MLSFTSGGTRSSPASMSAQAAVILVMFSFLPPLPSRRAGPSPGAKAARWLMDHQNEDGGWGETGESYANP